MSFWNSPCEVGIGALPLWSLGTDHGTRVAIAARQRLSWRLSRADLEEMSKGKI